MSKAPSKILTDRALERQALKDLISGYKGFGSCSLIRALVFRSPRCCFLALINLMILFGQWIGPIGFVSMKFLSLDFAWCAGGAGIWAQFIMSSIAMIYFARLSLEALAHQQKLPKEFEPYNIPEWWRFYRHLDIVVTSLFYDTCIFMANLLIVFDDANIVNMVVDVLTLEFFTLLDDEFKRVLLDYESSFLDDFMITPDPKRAADAGREFSRSDSLPASRYSERSSSWQPTPLGAPLTQTLFDVGEDDGKTGGGQHLDTPGVEERGGTGHTYGQGHDHDHDGMNLGGCIDGVLLVLLGTVRLACRVGGPAFALVMIFYGPLCLGSS